MDDLFNLIAGDQPAAKTTPAAAKKTAGRGDPTKEQIFGRNDLADYIKSAQESLPQMVPGSDLHSRTTRDLAEAQKAFSGMSGGQPQAAQQTAAQPVQQASSDPLLDLISGTSATTPQTEKTAGAPDITATKKSAFRPSNVVQQTLQNALDLRKQAPGFVASTLDVLGNIPSAVAGTVGYGVGRLFGLNPEEATASSGKVSGALRNPIGRLTGMAETPEYQNAAPTRVAEIIGSLVGKGAEAVGKATGVNPTDIEQGVSAAMMAAPFVKAPIGRGVNAVKAALPEYTTQVAGAAPTVATKGAMGQSVGAAATAEATQLAELLTRASPELQTAVKTITDTGHKIDPAGLKSLENHVNFEEFGMKATPGEATQNIAKLSDEYNSVKTNPEIAARLQERDPKLIEGFNRIKEDFAPQAHAVDQPTRSSTVLEGLKEKYTARQDNIAQKYQDLRDANGGEFPVDGQTFANNAIKQLHKDLSYDATPPVLLKALERFAGGEKMTFEQFERLRTITATEMRKGGTEAHAAGVVRQALEELPLTGNVSSTLKPLADAARNAAREQKQLMDPKSPKYNAAYTAAASDTRSLAEIAQGIPHPASANFFDKHVVGKGASEMQLRRALDELAGNQAAIDELRAGVIHEAKTKSGIKDDTGSVSQAALNDFINKQMTGKLDAALGTEAAAKLRRLSDVATKSEHVRKGGYANVSKTAIAETPSPMVEKLKSSADVATQGALTMAHPVLGFGYGVLKAGLKGKAEAKAIAKAAADQEKINKASVAPGGGITYTPLSQIGKK